MDARSVWLFAMFVTWQFVGIKQSVEPIAPKQP